MFHVKIYAIVVNKIRNNLKPQAFKLHFLEPKYIGMLSLFQDFDQLFVEHSRVNILSFWDLTIVALVYSWGWLMVLNYIYIKVDKKFIYIHDF